MKPKTQDLCKEKKVQMTPIWRKETCGCCFLSAVNTPFPANSIGTSVGFVLPALVPGVLPCQEGLGTSGILQVGTARGLHATQFYQSTAWCRNGALSWGLRPLQNLTGEESNMRVLGALQMDFLSPSRTPMR